MNGHHRWRAVVPINKGILRKFREIPQKGIFGVIWVNLVKCFPIVSPHVSPYIIYTV